MVSKMADWCPHIVMIDDDEDDQYIYRKNFESCNENLIFNGFTSGAQVFEHYSKGKGKVPTFILLDLNIPKDDGIDILMSLKQHPVLKMVPVLVLTTSSSPLDIQDCYELGVHSYFVKPMTLQETKDLIAAIYEYWFNQNFIPRLNIG